MADLYSYLGNNIKYPVMAKESGIQGKVYVTFVVERDGSITDVKVLRGIGGGCDEEAVRVVASMPRWKPGKQRGKPVRVQYNLPVRFTLQ
jgi:protein TonB